MRSGAFLVKKHCLETLLSRNLTPYAYSHYHLQFTLPEGLAEIVNTSYIYCY